MAYAELLQLSQEWVPKPRVVVCVCKWRGGGGGGGAAAAQQHNR